jgi:hypothetical protein
MAGTTRAEVSHAAVLAGLKLLALPALYAVLGDALHVATPLAFLAFLGGLPASPSVYSLSLVNGLSP